MINQAKKIKNKFKDIWSKGFDFEINLFRGLSIKDQAFFAKRLSFLIKAGVPILESLQMIRSQTKSKNHSISKVLRAQDNI